MDEYTKLAEEFLDNIYSLSKHKTHKEIHASLHGETVILQYIALQEKAVLPGKISQDLHVTTARIATALKGLERKGFITRRMDEEDRRKILVELTDLGKKVVKKDFKQRVKKVAAILEALGEEDAKHYVRIVSKLSQLNLSCEEDKEVDAK